MRPLESGGRCLVPRLLAVNVGLPKDVPWRGSTVHTGIWKQPVAGPRMVRRLNIDGDGQGDLAGHGGEHRAVLVYQIASYGYWQEQLGRDDFSYGQFGENFTIEGMADDEVCIGDCYRIGEAEFEVTQPRVTCYRVGLRMDEPRMAALLVAHGRPGFYLRVRTEGRVEAGNEIVKVASGPQRMTIAEMSALLYLPGHARQELARALTIPELSPGWKTSLRALLDQADGEQGRATGNSGLTTVAGGPPPAWAGFRPLRVVGVDAESRDVFSVRLASGDTAPLPTALPGQFLTLRLHPRVDGPPVIRSYSLSGRPGADDRQGVDYATPGRLSADLLDQLEFPRTADAYLCGPPAFMRELTDALVSLGLDPTHIHTETFSAEPAQTPGVVATLTRPPHPPAGKPGAGAPVSFARSRLTVNWDAGYASLLELAEACDVPVSWDCRTGVCHSCETGLLSGSVAYSPEPIEEPAEGNALICCSQPQGALVLDL